MKKRLLLAFVLILTALLALAACSSDLEDGELDVDPGILDKLPCSVDVTGLEEVSGTVNVQFVNDTDKAAALTSVREIAFVEEDATVYAVDISIKKDGEEITVGKPVTVSIELKSPVLPLDRYVVYHIHDGAATEIVPTVDGNKLTFTVSDFSVFMVVPKHVHTAGQLVVDQPATCKEEGKGHTVCAKCGATVETKKIQTGDHDWDTGRIVIAPTCGKAGTKLCTCKVCSTKKTETIAATGNHTPGAEWLYNAESGKEYRECTTCHTVLEERTPTAPHTNIPFVGVTIGNFVGYNGAIYDYSVFANSAAANAFLSRVTISLFDDGVWSQDHKQITGASFEIYGTDADGALEWAIFGTYSAKEGDLSCAMQVKSYYDAKTGKYYHGYHVDKFPRTILEVNGGLGFNTDKGLYEVSSYVSAYNGAEDRRTIAVKGSFFFGKKDNAPVRLADLPTDTNADYYERFVDGKVYGFNQATGKNAAAFSAAYSEAKISFFADNYLEFRTNGLVVDGDVAPIETVFCGAYRIEMKDGGYEIVFNVSAEYMDGELIPGATDVFTVAYDAATDKITLTDDGTDIVFAYDSSATPTRYVAPAAPDNWDAAKIEQAFRAVGAVQDLTMPKLSGVKAMTVGDLVDGKVTVTCVLARSKGQADAQNYQRETLYAAFYDCGYVGNEYFYLTANNECKFGVAYATADGVTTLTVTIERFDPEYPSAAIADYLTAHSVTDDVIEFKSKYAEGYSFAGSRLLITLRRDADATAVKGALISALTTDAGYGEETATGGRVYYASENKQIVFSLTTPEDGSAGILVSFFDSSVLPIRDYPATAIAAYLTGTSDALPPLSNENAVEYKFYPNEGSSFASYRMDLPTSMSGAAVASGLSDTLKAAGYKANLVAVYQTGRDFYSTYDVLLSPNKEIGIWISGAGGGAGSTESWVEASVFNLVALEGETYAVSVTPTNYSANFRLGERFNFTGYFVVTFNDDNENHTFTVYPDEFTFSEVDTSTPGEKTVTAVYRGNTDLSATFTINVTSRS